MSERVWDASALLALLNDEPSTVDLPALLPGAVVSAVNLSEVVTKLSDRGMPDPEARKVLEALPLTLVPFDDDQAYRAAALRPATRSAGLSLGDRACLALAAARGLPALTADRSWSRLDLPVEVEPIR